MSGSSNDVWLKKPQTIRYSYNFNQELNRLMGAYGFFITNGQYERAFRNLDNAINHVSLDPELRLFRSNKKSNNEIMKDVSEFVASVKLFRGIFIGRASNNKFSYMELRPKEKPTPSEDKVWIARSVGFFAVWGHYNYDYLVHVIGFAYKIPGLNAQGFPIETIKASFSFTDGNIMKKSTNCVPYLYWEENVREVLKILLPRAKAVEHRIAQYLHGDLHGESGEISTGQGAVPVVQIDYSAGEAGPGGYDFNGGYLNTGVPDTASHGAETIDGKSAMIEPDSQEEEESD